jgi:CRISPR-associated endonuclease/helicase Cas3
VPPPDLSFEEAFRALTGHAPFSWQRALHGCFVAGDFPASCNLPTGLGKTSVIPIWLLALARAPALVPRRLVYVVNRRTVVDQATREAEKLRANLASLPSLAARLKGLAAVEHDQPLAISTLRGQFADNGAWRADPARPSVVVGTVDMIGSRLLFSGYGCGFRSRPLHAGFLGQDALLVHDEAHLEPAFQSLVEAVAAEQGRCGEFRRLRVMALTATPRGGGKPFELSDEDRAEAEVKRRLEAVKHLSLLPVDDEKKTADEVTRLALEHLDSGRAVLVFLRKLDDVEKVAEALAKKKATVQRLTGTLRGLERDGLATGDPVFARFLPPGDRRCEAAKGTAYLVCTSAGEVGVNLSADHLVCDLAPFDGMAQRFGRVNRFGVRDDTRVAVVHPAGLDDEDEYHARRGLTLGLLRRLDGDASPAALTAIPPQERVAAFSPTPFVPAATDILFDAWALTSIREPLPGRPPVADWLHGVSGREPPETFVAWREEVSLVTGDLLDGAAPEDLLSDYPLKPHELLRDLTDRVFNQLRKLAAPPETPVWLADEDSVRVTALGELLDDGREALNGLTVILPPAAGGLDRGFLSGGSPKADDVADEWFEDDARAVHRRRRLWDDEEPEAGMRLVRVIDTRPDAGEEAEGPTGRRFWRWYVRPRSADDDGSTSATREQKLDDHQAAAEAFAGRVVAALGLAEPERSTVVLAARGHDEGKNRLLWQASIGNHGYDPGNRATALAKSDRRAGRVPVGYRHEFGSLLDVHAGLPDEARDLALHLIAAHHGRGRPHFSPDEAFDPEAGGRDTAGAAHETPRRFARLQRKYGRWGLAYLESLLRAADILASQPTTGGA